SGIATLSWLIAGQGNNPRDDRRDHNNGCQADNTPACRGDGSALHDDSFLPGVVLELLFEALGVLRDDLDVLLGLGVLGDASGSFRVARPGVITRQHELCRITL